MGIFDDPTEVAVGGTDNLPATNELPVDMHSKMFSAFPGLTPLTVVLGKFADSQAHNFRIDWQEVKEVPTTVIVATTEASAGATIVVVANGPTLVADTLLYNPRNDDLRIVDSVPTTQSVTVTVDQGGKTSTIWQSGDVIHVLLPALAENDETARNVSVADQNVFNFEQICKLQYRITRLMDAMTTHFGGRGSKREQLKQQKFKEYRIKKEKLMTYGGRATGGTAPATKRMMGGLVHYLRDGTNFKDFNGIMTETGFRNFIGDYKDENPDATEVMYFAAGNVIDLITDFGLDKVRLDPFSKEIGLDVLRYKSRGLLVRLIANPLMDVPVTEGFGYLLDMERITMKTIDRDTFFPHDRNAGAGELMTDTYRGVYSLLVGNETRHAMSVGALL